MPSFGQSATVWNVGGRWDITPALFVRGAVGTAFRLPTAEELFASDPPGNPNWIGNPNLKPERSTNINASIGGTIGDNIFNWEIIGFWRDVEDLIDTVFIEDLEVDVFDNLPDTVEVRGVEAVIEANINQNFSGKLSFTFSSAEMEGKQIQRVPEQYGSLTLDYHPMDLPFGVTLAARYVGDVYRTLGDLGDTPYGNYVVIDLGARVFLDAERHHRLDFNLHNLFDEDYSTRVDRVSGDEGPFVLNSLGWPRTFLFRYTYAFF
jgi:vitamin B12 transporter